MPTGTTTTTPPTATPATLPASPSTHSHTRWTDKRGPATPVQVGDPLAFYSVSATVLPVFFLALVYQANIIDKAPFKMPSAPHRLKRFERVIALAPPLISAGVLFYAVFGEFFALHILATRTPREIDKTYIGLGLYASGITLAFQRLVLVVENRETKRGLSEPGMMLRLVELAFLLMLVLGLVLFMINLVKGLG